MFVTTITPRVSETDLAGHINNTTVPIWLEAGRRELFRILTPDLSFANWRAAIVHMTIDYVDQLHLSADATVRIAVEAVGTKSFTLVESIEQEGRECVRARAVYVYYDFANGRSEPIPEAIRARLERHRAAAES